MHLNLTNKSGQNVLHKKGLSVQITSQYKCWFSLLQLGEMIVGKQSTPKIFLLFQWTNNSIRLLEKQMKPNLQLCLQILPYLDYPHSFLPFFPSFCINQNILIVINQSTKNCRIHDNICTLKIYSNKTFLWGVWCKHYLILNTNLDLCNIIHIHSIFYMHSSPEGNVGKKKGSGEFFFKNYFFGPH